MTVKDIETVIREFQESAIRAVEAGIDAIEIHAAHGYLIHQFQSRYTNKREDEYGINLSKFGCEIVAAVKGVIPESMPLIMRISAVEYVEGGYGIDHAVALAKDYQRAGIDIFHVSSGGEGPIGGIGARHFEQGYQVPYAERIKNELKIPTIAVGKILDFKYSNQLIERETVDLIAIGRGMLHDPYWTLHAQEVLELEADNLIPQQYVAGFHKG